MSRELKVANGQKGRKLRLKIYLTEQKCCNLLPQIEKQQQQQQQQNKKKKKCKQMWEMESAKQDRCRTLQEKKREKKVFQKVKRRGN